MITDGHEEELGQVFEREGVVAAYLFGSHAREQAHGLSDVDIGVLFAEGKSGQERFEAVIDLISDLQRILGVPQVDVVDMEEAPIMLRYPIQRDGQLIYCADARRRVSFLALSMSMYFDFLPSRQLYYKHLLSRLERGGLGERFRYKRDH